MKREETIKKRVEKAFFKLEHPDRYVGTVFFEQRVKAALNGEQYTGFGSPWLGRLAGVAAGFLLVINVAFFARAGWDKGAYRTQELDLLLEAYTVVPATNWSNYLGGEENNASFEN